MGDSELAMELERLRAENEALLDAQRVLEESRDSYAELFEFSPFPLLTLDGAHGIRLVNRAAAALFGQEPSRLVARYLRSYVDAEDRRLLSEHLAQAYREPAKSTSCELKLIPHHGSPLPVRMSVRFCPGSGGAYLVGMVDLLAQTEAAEERRQLLESERNAREASTAKDNFIAMLSHELRTPLTPVLAAASALKDRSDLDPELRKLLDIVQRNVLSEARLIDDLLDVSRIVRGKMQVDREPLDAHQVVSEVVEATREEASRKHLRIEVRLEADRHRVSADPLRLRQVIANLLRNAVKFSHDGAEIQLSTWNTEHGIAVEVEDRGVGIEPEAISSLFDPFTQVDQTRKMGGLGLGLTISKGLVELHGGKIEVASRGRDQGARFVIELPILQERQMDAAPVELSASLEPPSSSAPPPSSRKRRVLLIEDDPDTAETMGWALGSSGYDVQTAGSMKSALDVDLGRVDVIVSDLGLPDGSGLDLIQQLQAKAHKPAIALSGFGMESDVLACKEAGFDLHLTKPVSLDQLVGAIESLQPGP